MIGEIYGLLTVVRGGGRKIYGGRQTHHWWCQCECGREELIPQPKIKQRAGGCWVCRRGPCIVCGGEITAPDINKKTNVCSEQCTVIKNRSAWNRHYAKKTAVDPEHNQRRHRRNIERMQYDPEYAARVRRIRRNSGERYRNKPKNQERAAIYQAERWQAHRNAILEQRNRFWESLSETERKARTNDRKIYQREYKRNFRKWLLDNPEEYEQFKSRYREYSRERQRQIELGKLRAVAQSLQNRSNDNDE